MQRSVAKSIVYSKRRATGALLSLCLLLPTPVTAQEFPNAVGRISAVDADGNRLGDAICTGTLIAPDLVLTEGHCLKGATGRNHIFQPAFGAPFVDLTIRGAAVEPLPIRETGVLGLDNDLALLRLSEPIREDQAKPVPVTGTAENGAAWFFGYDRAAPDHLPDARPCKTLARFPDIAPRVIALDCPVTSGNSGGPLIVDGPKGPALVAVMVAKGQPPFNAFAVVPPELAQ